MITSQPITSWPSYLNMFSLSAVGQLSFSEKVDVSFRMAFISSFCLCVVAACCIMSDSDSDNILEHLDPSGELLPEIAHSSSAQRKSARIAQAEQDFLISQLRASGISPAPGLKLSQLKEMASLLATSGSPNASSADEAVGPAVSFCSRKRPRLATTTRSKKGKSSSCSDSCCGRCLHRSSCDRSRCCRSCS